MIFLISPAKTLDFSERAYSEATLPRHLDDTAELVALLKPMSTSELRQLMSISEKLAVLNQARYRDFATPFTPDNAKPSILAFQGDVYRGLDAATFDEDDLRFADRHIRILSGLYGMLRPLDLMQPYRLEMGTKLANARGKNLYDFWGGRLTEQINEDLAATQSDAVVNLASKEYFKAVQPDRLDGRLLNIDFKEERDGAYKIVALYAKQARGMMCRYAVQHRIAAPEALKQFDMEGYAYHEELSSDDHWIFTR